MEHLTFSRCVIPDLSTGVQGANLIIRSTIPGLSHAEQTYIAAWPEEMTMLTDNRGVSWYSDRPPGGSEKRRASLRRQRAKGSIQ